MKGLIYVVKLWWKDEFICIVQIFCLSSHGYNRNQSYGFNINACIRGADERLPVEHQVLPVVEDDGEADQSAAADRHGDDEGQPMRADLCGNRKPVRSELQVLHNPFIWGRTHGNLRRQRGPQVLVAEVGVAALDRPPGLSVGGVLSITADSQSGSRTSQRRGQREGCRFQI